VDIAQQHLYFLSNQINKLPPAIKINKGQVVFLGKNEEMNSLTFNL